MGRTRRSGRVGNIITVYAICATEPAGYDVVSSSPLVFGDGGYGGWSCPAGTVVLGGGFNATDTVAVSAPGTPGSIWPHHTFSPSESGWVVRDDLNSAGNTITVYAICATEPAGSRRRQFVAASLRRRRLWRPAPSGRDSGDWRRF